VPVFFHGDGEILRYKEESSGQGPIAPKGKEQNWIPTVAGKAWFPYFRLYSPKKAFLDQTWVLPNIEKVKYPRMTS